MVMVNGGHVPCCGSFDSSTSNDCSQVKMWVQCVLEFPLACGITVGTPVRIRGVPVGSVLTVNPSLEKVEVLVEVRCCSFRTFFLVMRCHCWYAAHIDDHVVLNHLSVYMQVKKSSTVIPRNSHIEANQSGLIAEPLIDITPQLPIPDYKASFFLLLHRIICAACACASQVRGVPGFSHLHDMHANAAVWPEMTNWLQASPLDAACEAEGKVVCHQGHIKGQPGGHCNRLQLPWGPL